MKMLFCLTFVVFCLIPIQTTTWIKVGLLIPKNDPILSPDVGMNGSIGAVPMAIDRIRQENLLNDFNFSFYIYNDECHLDLAAGYASRLFEKDQIDVIFGPVCDAAAINVGSLGTFFNKPIMTWGLVTTYQLFDYDKYPTVSTISGTTQALGKALMKILRYFDWQQFGFLYAVTDQQTRCSFIREDLQRFINREQNVFINFQKALTNTSLETIKSALLEMKNKAKIIVTCYEFDDDKRKHLIALNETNMNSDDIVTIFVGLRGIAFGTRFTAINGTDIDDVSQTMAIWAQNPEMTQDGKNNVAKYGARNAFFLDFQVKNTSKSFAANQIEKAKSWPFYCETCNYTSSYARYLYDSFYLYAVGLNRTLKIVGNNTALAMGKEIVANTKGVYVGATGQINIGDGGYRDSTFSFSGLDINYRSREFITVVVNDSGTFLIEQYSDPSVVWDLQNGKKPLDVPICGFDGNSCPINIWNAYGLYLICSGVVFGVIIFCGCIYFYLYNQKQTKKLNQLWQIKYNELDELFKNGNISNRSSEFANETKIQKFHNHQFFMYRQEKVAAKIFLPPIVLTRKNHNDLRKMARISSSNCNRFVGLCLDGPVIYAIWDYCNRGSLMDVIADGKYIKDQFVAISVVKDIVKGLAFIHSQPFLKYHGHLTSKNCVVDDRWTVKLSDYGCHFLYANYRKTNIDQLWISPELIRSSSNFGTQQGDIYSFAIICSEFLTGKLPWNYTNYPGGIDELIYSISKGGTKPIRPDLSTIQIPDLKPKLISLIKDCWDEEIHRFAQILIK